MKIKKSMSVLLALVMLLGLMSTTALAADASGDSTGIYDLKVTGTGATFDVKPYAESTEVTATGGTVDGSPVSDFYPGAVRLQVNYTLTTPKEQDLILLLKGTAFQVTADTIAYIDQKPGNQAVSFNVYPNSLSKGDYSLWHVSSNGTAEQIASFKYNQPYMLGDIVSPMKRITASDAYAALKISVGLTEKGVPWTDMQKKAADVVSPLGRVTASDAYEILKKSVGLPAGF